MSQEMLIAVMFGGVLFGLLLGHPVAFVLTGLAIVFGYISLGDRIWPLFVNRIWQTSTNHILIAIPLFIFMASILERSGIAEGLFRALMYAFGALRGAIALAVVVLSTVFAAITGVSIASATVFSRVAVPEMRRYGYTRRFATGVVAGSSVLGMLIPPSLLLIVYAVLAEQSVGRMFLAGVGPGLLLSAAFTVTILALAWRRPAL
jgi:tripartite ATP-independent transporter DctM subunit